MSRKALLLVVAVLLATNLYSVYRTVDTGVTVTYMQDSWESQQENKKLLGRIAVELAGGQAEAQIEQAIRRTFSASVIERQGNTLYVDEVGLRFREGKLASVVFMNDAPEGSEPPR